MRFLGQRGTKPGVVEEYLPVCFSPRNKEGKKQMKKRYRNRRNGNGVRRIRERKERTGMEPDDASGACSPRMAVAERSPRPPPPDLLFILLPTNLANAHPPPRHASISRPASKYSIMLNFTSSFIRSPHGVETSRVCILGGGHGLLSAVEEPICQCLVHLVKRHCRSLHTHIQWPAT